MKELDREAFGAFLASLRRERGWTQKELAQQLYVTDKAVSKWERGLSMPDPALLLPLAELFGVSVTELLQGRRMEAQEALPHRDVEALVQETLQLLSEERRARQVRRREWRRRYGLCLALVGAEFAALWVLLRIPGEEILYCLGLLEGMCLLFGGYFCLGAKETLPPYYDQYPVHIYSDGVFRMNFPGLTFNNRNWPHILRLCRVWLLALAVVWPLLYGGICALFPAAAAQESAWIFAGMAAVFSFFLPMLAVGKRYA